MILTVEDVLAMPGLNNTAALPVNWLNKLVGVADSAVKRYLKRNIECQALAGYYSGTFDCDVILRQWPVLMGNTTIASGSNGLTLPQATINVATTQGFDPGISGTPTQLAPALSVPVISPTLAVQTGTNTWTTVQYTGVTATSFTGCTGGTGTLTTGNAVYMPAVFVDPTGYAGQSPSGFAAGTQQFPGTGYILVTDDETGQRSNRGLLRLVAGQGSWWPTGYAGYAGYGGMPGKLGGYRAPGWPRGVGNIKVMYSAGYVNGQVPYEITRAAMVLVAKMVKDDPNGTTLSSENLGNYSYSILANDREEFGSVRQQLSQYKEMTFCGL